VQHSPRDETPARSVRDEPVTSPPARPGLALASIALGASLGPLDSAVNVAFPNITAAFAQPVSAMRWVVIVYVLTYASLLLAFGRMADLFGHRRVFLAGLVWCTAALALCAVAQAFPWLLGARVAQGVGTALLLASAPALVTLSLPPEQRTRGIAVYTFAFACASAVGPVAGGLLVQAFGWPAVFWMRVPLAVAAIVLTLRHVPAPEPAAAGARFDGLSGAALALGLAGVLLGTGQGGNFGWSSPFTLALLLGGAALLAFFARRQRTPAHRVIDLALFRELSFTVANLCHVLLNSANFMILLFVPFYLARAHGESGVLLLALAPTGFALGSPLAERALRRASPHAVGTAALLVSTAFIAAIALWPERAPVAWIALVLLGAGIGYGLFQVAVMDLVMGGLSRANQGVAGSLNMVTRTIGVVLGASAGAALFDATTPTAGFAGAFAAVFHGAWVINALAALLMLALGRPRAG